MTTAELPAPVAAIAQFGIQPRPSQRLDRVLDAAERCLARHGVRRTTMSDIAKEMGVSRPTLYKHLGSVEEAVALVTSRELYLFVDEIVDLLVQDAGPDTLIDMAVRAVTLVRTHPVTARILAFEPELVGEFITTGQVTAYVEQLIDVVAPLVEAAIQAGTIRSGEARLTAELMLRLCASFMLAPSNEADRVLRVALEAILAPPRAARVIKQPRRR